MKMTNSFLLVSLVLIWSSVMADSQETVNMVYTEKPNGENQDSYNLHTLSAVLGSEEKAKDALIYNYESVGGFSAKLTPEETAQIKKQPGVLEVVPSKSAQLQAGTHNLRV
ncbi:subtilisin-like protease SBT3.17 [Cornus florida]|uniref:subtilisin-like protease SBT3.17 n=1 Tax=Cornus florida TaxID=4283 RepID=UPI002899BC19|nr:subtilisin-like protease SBT3.17 [Cornus florida]